MVEALSKEERGKKSGRPPQLAVVDQVLVALQRDCRWNELRNQGLVQGI